MNKETWSDEFEAGRQDVVSDLKKTIERQLKFMRTIEFETENMAYSLEKRQGIILTYVEILETIDIFGDKRDTINLMAIN